MNGMSEDVARRAYELFLARGGEHGRDMDDWLEAERQLAANGTRAHRHIADPPAKSTGLRPRRSTAARSRRS
jgi:hypothetical protein